MGTYLTGKIMTIFLKKLPFDTATQTRNTERAFPFREGSFAAQALFINDMFWPKLFEKKHPLPIINNLGKGVYFFYKTLNLMAFRKLSGISYTLKSRALYRSYSSIYPL